MSFGGTHIWRRRCSGANSSGNSPGVQPSLRQLVHRLPLLFFAVASALGICLDVWLRPLTSSLGPPGFLVFWIACAIVLGLLALVSRSTTRLVALFVTAIPLAAAWHTVCDARFDAATISSITSEQPQATVIEVRIDRPISLRRHPLAGLLSRRDQSPWQTQFEATVDRVRVGQDFQPFTGRVLVVCDGRLDQLLPGDQLRVFGWIRDFRGPTNPGEPDLRGVYRRRGLQARVEADGAEQVVRLASQPGDPISRWIASIARFSRDVLMQYTSETNGPLALALVIGQRELVESETRDLLLVTGTAHLLSVSGLHLAIVVVMARWIGLLLGLPLAGRIIWIIAVCALYTAITGGRPPVMRTSILVATFMISIWIHRQGQPINTLSLAALILMMLNPENVFSVGVQLSFLAVGTLLLCGRRASSSTPAVQQALPARTAIAESNRGSIAEAAAIRPLGRFLYLASRLVQRLCDSRQHSAGVVSISRRFLDQRRGQRDARAADVCGPGCRRCYRLGWLVVRAAGSFAGPAVRLQPYWDAGCDQVRRFDSGRTFLASRAACLVGCGVLCRDRDFAGLDQQAGNLGAAPVLDRDLDDGGLGDRDGAPIDERLCHRSNLC